MMRLASGRIALVWNSPPAGGKPRPLAEVLGQLPPRKGDEYFYATSNPQMTRTEVSIAFSEDEGRTWTEPTLIKREPEGVAYFYMFEREPGLLWIMAAGGRLRVTIGEEDLVGN